jgi:large subunit ribosomal protein L23
MAILNVFKKKAEENKPAEKKVKSAPKKRTVSVKKEVKKEEVKREVSVSSGAKKDSESAYRILRGPHITEKADSLTAFGQYIFNVYRSANKSEVKKTVEEIYGVKVVAVKIINIHPKKRRLGKVQGWKQGYKKAVVKLELLPR